MAAPPGAGGPVGDVPPGSARGLVLDGAAAAREASSSEGPEATQSTVQQASVACAEAVEHGAPQAVSAMVFRALAGDARALETIVRAELPRVERLLRRILGPRADLEDLVQTVFLELCRALPSFRGESAFSTFVGGITVRVARRAMRPSAWRRLAVFMDPNDAEGISPDRPEANVVAGERIRRLDRALSKLTAPKRIAFVLWAVDGLEAQAIAEAMGASLAATRSRIYYAQKELAALAALDPHLRELVEEIDA